MFFHFAYKPNYKICSPANHHPSDAL
jgi:hypothetical protein